MLINLDMKQFFYCFASLPRLSLTMLMLVSMTPIQVIYIFSVYNTVPRLSSKSFICLFKKLCSQNQLNVIFNIRGLKKSVGLSKSKEYMKSVLAARGHSSSRKYFFTQAVSVVFYQTLSQILKKKHLKVFHDLAVVLG